MNNRNIYFNAIMQAHKNDPNLMSESVTDFCIKLGKKSDDYYEVIILSHKFAKAYWGEEHIKARITSYTDNECDEIIHKIYKPGTGNMIFCADDFNRLKEQVWQYHLQQMVLEKERLKYIEKFLILKNCKDVMGE